tara:strand:- start:16 stop:345 length:330 start_codon:yes stop_codon:yes gene_type:complete
MSTRLLLLKSGEDVIADVTEMLVEDKVVGYYLKYPCRVNLVSNVERTEGSSKIPSKIQLLPWMPMSKDKTVPIPSDWVVTIVEPIEQVENMFLDGVEKYEKSKADSVDE